MNDLNTRIFTRETLLVFYRSLCALRRDKVRLYETNPEERRFEERIRVVLHAAIIDSDLHCYVLALHVRRGDDDAGETSRRTSLLLRC